MSLKNTLDCDFFQRKCIAKSTFVSIFRREIGIVRILNSWSISFSRHSKVNIHERSWNNGKTLFDRYKLLEIARSGVEKKVQVLGAEAAEKGARASGVERELKVEREWRTSLQEASISKTEKISQLHQEIEQLRQISEVNEYTVNISNPFRLIPCDPIISPWFPATSSIHGDIQFH